MNKADIVGKVQEVLGGTRADADRAVECVIESITSGLRSGDARQPFWSVGDRLRRGTVDQS